MTKWAILLHICLIHAIVTYGVREAGASSRNIGQWIPSSLHSRDERFCGYQEGNNGDSSSSYFDNCNWIQYVNNLVISALGPLVLALIAVVLMVGSPVYLYFPKLNRASPNRIWRIVAFSMISILFSAGFALMFIGSYNLSHIVSESTQLVDQATAEVQWNIQSMQEIANEFPDPIRSTITSEVTNVYQKFVADTKEIQLIESTIENYERIRSMVIFVATLVPMAAVLFAIVSTIIFPASPKLLIFIILMLLFVSILAWLAMSVHLVIRNVDSDVCKEIQLELSSGQTLLGIQILCNPNSSLFQNILGDLDSFIAQSVENICVDLERTCLPSGGPVSCMPSPWNCNTNTFANWTNFYLSDIALECTDGKYADPAIGCYNGSSTGSTSQIVQVIHCPLFCNNPSYANFSSEGISSIQQVGGYQHQRTEVARYLTCGDLQPDQVRIENFICSDIAHHIDLITSGCALEAIACGMAAFLFWILYKTFRIAEDRETEMAEI